VMVPAADTTSYLSEFPNKAHPLRVAVAIINAGSVSDWMHLVIPDKNAGNSLRS
jgi:hypothetical protein